MSTSDSPGRRTRDIILDAAAELIAERGPQVTLEEISRRAGVSRQSVYVHFGSRAGLLIALAQHIDARGHLDALLEQVFCAGTAIEALESVVHLHAEYSPEAYPLARAMMTARREDEELLLAWNDRMQGRRNLYRFVIEWLEREDLLARHWDVETAIDMLSALASWQVWEHLVIDLGWTKEQYQRHLGEATRRTLTADMEERLQGPAQLG